MGPGVGAHCGTLQQIGSWGSTTSVQPAGTGLYTLHLQRQHRYIILAAKRRCTPCTCKGNMDTLYLLRDDVHLAPAKATQVRYTGCQEKMYTLHLQRQHGYERRHTSCTCQVKAYVLHLQRQHGYVVHAKRRHTSCTCKDNTGMLYMRRKDENLAPQMELIRARYTPHTPTLKKRHTSCTCKGNTGALYLPREDTPCTCKGNTGRLLLTAKRRHTPCTCKGNTGVTCQEKTYTLYLQREHGYYLPREDIHLALAKATRVNLTAVHFRTIQLTNGLFFPAALREIYLGLSTPFSFDR